MKNILIISSLLLVLVILSCRKKLDIDIPEAAKHIVVNGIITTDSIVKVRVTKSKSILDEKPVEILSSAEVKLYKDDIFTETMTYNDSGFFMSSVSPVENSDYKITVDYPGLTSVEANYHSESPTDILSVDTSMRININDWGEGYIDTTYEIRLGIKIKDDAAKDNYYFLGVSLYRPVYDYSDIYPIFTGYYENPLYYNSNEPFFKKENISFMLSNTDGRVFNDEIFNGKEYVINISADIYTDYYYYKRANEQYPDYLIIKFLTVTADIYNYIISYNLNRQSEYDPFAQPVQVYSNVKNGLGLFSGYTLSTDTIKLNY